MAIKDMPIEKFGTKLMVSSKSINKIPDEYMQLALNARIYDGGIWPRRWKQLVTESTLWTNNKGGFILWDRLFQITNSKIYEIDKETGIQTEKVDLWFDLTVDVLTYKFPKGAFTTVDPFVDKTYVIPVWENQNQIQLEYKDFETLNLRYFQTDPDDEVIFDTVSGIWSNENKFIPAIRILDVGSSWFFRGFNQFAESDGSSGVILREWGIAEQDTTWITPKELRVEFGFYAAQEQAIIVAKNGAVLVFDWESITNEQSIDNNAIIEYARWYSFLASDNILRVSAPITVTNPENAYDFTGTESQQLVFDSEITWLKGTLTWLYIFTKTRIEFIWPNWLQNLGWTPVFTSYALWDWWEPINNLAITAAWDKIFYINKNLQVNTVNYIWWTDSPTIWELSARPVIGIKEFLNMVDVDQPTAFSFYNQNDKTIQFHIRTNNFQYNNRCLVYDIINDTWAIDIGKFYNYVVKDQNNYYWFSDINSNIYLDDTWFSDAWVSLWFKIVTQGLNQGSMQEKRYGGFFTWWWIWLLSQLDYTIRVDGNWVFQDNIIWDTSIIAGLWEIWWVAVWELPIWGDLDYTSALQPFNKWADEWRIDTGWTRMLIEISSVSQIQDFLIDILGARAEPNNNIDNSNKF